MNRKIAAAVVIVLFGIVGGLTSAQATSKSLILYDWNLDSTSYVCPGLATPASASSVYNVGGPGRPESRKITTSGASSATVTSVGSVSSFSNVSEGDVIQVSVPAATGSASSTVQYLRRIIDKTDANTVTIDSAITVPAAGVGFVWWSETEGTTASDGWWDYGRAGTDGVTVVSDIAQMSVTGGIDYKVECRHVYWDKALSPVIMAGPTNVTAAAVARVDIWGESYDQCRVCYKVGTNDNLDTVTNGANDNIDFIEDPDGTPVACVADIAAGTYTGAGLATAATTAMNTAGICAGATDPTDTYLVTFDEFTGKYTITRSGTPGYETFDLPWNTGASAATSADTLLGFSADIADAGTYTGAAVTHDIGAEAEKINLSVQRHPVE